MQTCGVVTKLDCFYNLSLIFVMLAINPFDNILLTNSIADIECGDESNWAGNRSGQN